MDEKKYTEEHEWVQLSKDTATVGITNYAQSELGDIIFVEFLILSIQFKLSF